ncbi:hypothetical protein BT69DRAFT_107372 [Atractiella rhizophila]|nr:hypothetical protein BT69DRAFT_107372 [Atractiella rhizophila]
MSSASLPSMPTVPKKRRAGSIAVAKSACVSCKLAKRKCVRDNPAEPCVACAQRDTQCISTGPDHTQSRSASFAVSRLGPREKRTGKILATAQIIYGDSSSYLPSSSIAGPSNRANNNLVLSNLASTLAYELLSHSYLQWPYPICNKIYPNLPALFEAKGRDASKVGKYAEVHVAVLIGRVASLNPTPLN